MLDLVFTFPPNHVMEFGVHSSLHQSCHHQIVHVKCNPKICYPPPYEYEVWYYKKVNTLSADQSMSFVLSNFLSNEIVIYDD